MVRVSTELKQLKAQEKAGIKPRSFSNRISDLAKRAFDCSAAFIGLLLLSPIFAFIAILIKRDSPGPVFYWAPRIGQKGIIFKMLKFRTMYETPKSYGGLRITGKEDDRITQLGKWLRDTKINELPQLWNVLIGQMSLVGPRPEDPEISKTWPTNAALELLSVRPGVTSPASILYRDEENMLAAGDVMRKYLHELSPDKMRLDQLYIRYRSFWLDLDVIFWTAILLLPKIKSYSPPEQLLFVGPMTRLIRRYVSWFIWDFLIVLMSIGITGIGARLFGPLNLGLPTSVKMALGFSMLFSAAGILLNTDRINWLKATSWDSGRLWLGWIIATIAMLGFYYFFGFTNIRIYGVMLIASTLSFIGIILIRYRSQLISGISSRLLTRQLNIRATRERVLIVGSGRTAEHIAWLMSHPTYSGKFQVAGFIDNDLNSHGMKIYGSKVIGRVEDIQKIVKEQDIGLVILADNQIASQNFKAFRNTASFNPARVMVAPDIFGSLSRLDGASADNDGSNPLDDFQCQNCLARHVNHHDQFQQVNAVESVEIH
ncbi:MAG: sugar transferase [Chloroflexi bacterium]|nr:sugar transferase [Chloroflexota bacterium]